MPLVSHYSHLQKLWDGAYETFNGLRAAGLAVEQGLRLCSQKGLGSLCLEDLEEVKVKGSLMVKDEHGQWEGGFRSCNLKVKHPEKSLALAIVKKVRAFLSDVGCNIFHIDCPMPERLGRYDLLCDFSRPGLSSVKGLVWVEVKVMSTSRAASGAIAELQDQLAEKLTEINNREPEVDGVMLLVAKTVKDSLVHWRHPVIHASLFSLDNPCWSKITPEGRVARGHCKDLKPALPQVLAAMDWHMMKGKAWGLLQQFLQKMSLPGGNAGKRAKTFNDMLGPRQQLVRKKLKDRCGSKPWVGTESTFQALHKIL